MKAVYVTEVSIGDFYSKETSKLPSDPTERIKILQSELYLGSDLVSYSGNEAKYFRSDCVIVYDETYNNISSNKIVFLHESEELPEFIINFTDKFLATDIETKKLAKKGKTNLIVNSVVKYINE